MPDKEQLELILEIFKSSARAQVAAGIVIGLGILYFVIRWIGALLKDLRGLLPANEDKQEKEKKKTGEVAAATDEPSEQLVQSQREFIAAQARFIDDQRALLQVITAATIKTRSLDDTIPLRDELLNKLTDESKELED